MREHPFAFVPSDSAFFLALWLLGGACDHHYLLMNKHQILAADLAHLTILIHLEYPR